MPLLEITDIEVIQRCAGCGALRRLPRAGLTAGWAAGPEGPITVEVIRLPICKACASEEFLVRAPDSPEHPAPGSFGHLHRLLVNHLHAALARAGQLPPGITEDQRQALGAAAPPEAELALRQWFPAGLRISPSLEAELPAPLRPRAQAPRGAEGGQ